MEALSRTLARLSACLRAPVFCVALAATVLPAAAAEFSASQTARSATSCATIS